MATVTPFPHTDTTWARTVHTVAANARATFPSLGGKIDHALALVLAGAVQAADAAALHRGECVARLHVLRRALWPAGHLHV